MKKLISVCMALVLALGLTGICLAESENAQPAPSPDPYSGIWQCDRATAEKKFKEFVSGLDKAVKKGIIAKNTADRKKSRAQLKLNKMAKAEAK